MLGGLYSAVFIKERAAGRAQRKMGTVRCVLTETASQQRQLATMRQMEYRRRDVNVRPT